MGFSDAVEVVTGAVAAGGVWVAPHPRSAVDATAKRKAEARSHEGIVMMILGVGGRRAERDRKSTSPARWDVVALRDVESRSTCGRKGSNAAARAAPIGRYAVQTAAFSARASCC